MSGMSSRVAATMRVFTEVTRRGSEKTPLSEMFEARSCLRSASPGSSPGAFDSHAELVFWGICALVGGPVFGAAGWNFRRGVGRVRGLGVATLAASFLARLR